MSYLSNLADVYSGESTERMMKKYDEEREAASPKPQPQMRVVNDTPDWIKEKKKADEARAKHKAEKKRAEAKLKNKLAQIAGRTRRIDRSGKLSLEDIKEQEAGMMAEFATLGVNKTEQKAMLKKARTKKAHDEFVGKGGRDPRPVKGTKGDWPQDKIDKCFDNILPSAYTNGELDLNKHWIMKNCMEQGSPTASGMEARRFLWALIMGPISDGYMIRKRCKVDYCGNPTCCAEVFDERQFKSIQTSQGNSAKSNVVFLVELPKSLHEKTIPEDEGEDFDTTVRQFDTDHLDITTSDALKHLGIAISTSGGMYEAILDFKRKKARAIENIGVKGKANVLSDVKFEDDFEPYIKDGMNFESFEKMGVDHTKKAVDRFMGLIANFNWRGSVVPCPHFHEALDAIRKAEKAIVKLNVGVV